MSKSRRVFETPQDKELRIWLESNFDRVAFPEEITLGNSQTVKYLPKPSASHFKQSRRKLPVVLLSIGSIAVMALGFALAFAG